MPLSPQSLLQQQFGISHQYSLLHIPPALMVYCLVAMHQVHCHFSIWLVSSARWACSTAIFDPGGCEIEVRLAWGARRGSACAVCHLTFELVTRPISFSFFLLFSTSHSRGGVGGTGGIRTFTLNNIHPDICRIIDECWLANWNWRPVKVLFFIKLRSFSGLSCLHWKAVFSHLVGGHGYIIKSIKVFSCG